MNTIVTIFNRFPRNNAMKICELFLEHIQQKRGGSIAFIYYVQLVFSGAFTGTADSYFQNIGAIDMVLPDGIALQLLARRILGNESAWKIFATPFKNANSSCYNLNGTDLIPQLFERIEERYSQWNIILYGAPSQVVGEAKEVLSKTYLHAQVYAFHGYTPKTIAQLLECCNADLPTILLVGTGFPRQEAFLAESQKEIHAAGILAFAVGGLIDRFAGKEHRGPEWVRTCKCEWLYRAIRNPRKNGLKAFGSLSIFFILIFWSYFE